MDKYDIAVIVGSLRRDSYNRKLADAIIKLAPSEFNFKHLEIRHLPLYNQDDDGNQADSVKSFKNDIKNSHGIIFATPEYNRGLPGVLKNAIDNASRPYGQSAWAGKPAGIFGASPEALALLLRNKICAIPLPIWMCQRSDNRKYLYK